MHSCVYCAHNVKCNKRMHFSIQIKFKSNESRKEMKPSFERMRMLENVIKCFEKKIFQVNVIKFIEINKNITREKRAGGLNSF